MGPGEVADNVSRTTQLDVGTLEKRRLGIGILEEWWIDLIALEGWWEAARVQK
jgi:hypothetical protein